MLLRSASLASLFGLLFLGIAKADVIGSEDFDGGAVNLSSTTNVFDYGAGGGSGDDVFGRVSSFAGGGTGGPVDVWDDTQVNNSGSGVNPLDTVGIAGQNTSGFFAMNDMDGGGAPGFTFATWSFDISLAASLDNIQMDLAALGDFEAAATDGFMVEAQIDGGGFFEIFRARTQQGTIKTYRPFDNSVATTDNDPLELFIDGVATGILLDKSDAATGLFDTYTSVGVAGMSGSTLDIRVSWTGFPSGNEPMGFDNIVINGDPIQAVGPEARKFLDGLLFAGNLADMFTSDDIYYEVDPVPTPNPIKQKVHLILQTTSPTDTPGTFKFRLESKMNGGPSGDVIQKIEMLNYDNGTLELMDLRSVAVADESIEITPGGDPTRFIQALTSEMTVHLVWTSDEFTGATFNWDIDIDEAVWLITD